MSFFLHTGKRGRPLRFDTQTHAIIAAVTMQLDARLRTRGRKPNNSSIVIVTSGGTTTIADSSSVLPAMEIVDSTVVTTARKSRITKPKPVPADEPEKKPDVAPSKPRPSMFKGDLSKITSKISNLTNEADTKNIKL